MSQSLEDRFRDMLVSALAVDHPENLRDLAGDLATEAARYFSAPAGSEKGLRRRRHGKMPVRAHGKGAATHNKSTAPGELQVTVWGVTDREPDREVALVLGEEDVKRLKANLERFGL